MAVFAIFIRDRMKDPEEFKTYSAKAGAARGDHPLKAHVYYGALEVLEGPETDGVVVVEFPDMAAAHAWYDSPAYQEAKVHRLKAADYRVILVEGFSPPGS
ncbi:DUF1330 domain-containing protein [Phenylobacterium sp.]|uniref:DUF1330 domain-containing protein n=1 Tax=Phenylobacterium sp. TaxID=1871053 RepID=UPI0025CFA560|nr:DUF1330 domain-containing protein [Phenylobacterium sp.]